MLRYLSLAVVCAAGLVTIGCKPKEQVEAEKNAVKAEQDKLQGKWKVASRTGELQEDEDAPPPSSYYVIEGDILKLVYLDNGKEEVDSYKKMVITPGKEPKQVDLVYVDANGKEIKSRQSKRSRGKTRTTTTTIKDVAVYKVEGDRLTLCISWDEKSRPTDFTAPARSSRYVLTLEKMKDGEKVTAAGDEQKGEPAAGAQPETGAGAKATKK